MSHHDDIIELPETPNLKTRTDSKGNTVTCWSGHQACEESDEIVYDRGFGG
jgi:hypothetical protein